MIIPSKMNILGFLYDVILTNDANILTIDDTKITGRIYYKEQKIIIDSNQNPQQLIQTLMHEVLHAIDFLVNGCAEGSLSEGQIDCFATGITSVLLNNNLQNVELSTNN